MLTHWLSKRGVLWRRQLPQVVEVGFFLPEIKFVVGWHLQVVQLLLLSLPWFYESASVWVVVAGISWSLLGSTHVRGHQWSDAQTLKRRTDIGATHRRQTTFSYKLRSTSLKTIVERLSSSHTFGFYYIWLKTQIASGFNYVCLKTQIACEVM